jgi:hypothetical protein
VHSTRQNLRLLARAWRPMSTPVQALCKHLWPGVDGCWHCSDQTVWQQFTCHTVWQTRIGDVAAGTQASSWPPTCRNSGPDQNSFCMAGRSCQFVLLLLDSVMLLLVLVRKLHLNVSSPDASLCTQAPVSVSNRSLLAAAPPAASAPLPAELSSLQWMRSTRMSALTAVGWKVTSSFTSCPGARKPSAESHSAATHQLDA